MQRRPLLVLGAAAAAGAALTQPINATVHVLLLAASACFFAWLLLARGEPERIRSLAALALVAGAVSASIHDAAARRGEVPPRTTRLACTALDITQAQGGIASYLCAMDSGPTLLIDGPGSAPPAGAHVLVRGRLEDFDGPRNPGEPDERALQAERGVAMRMSSAHVLARLPPAPDTPQIVIARMHAWALARLRARMDEPFASIAAGELWGARAALPPELRAEFQETGTVHILVTAGLHLGVVALIVMTLLRAVKTPRIAACVVAITTIWIYAVFSGQHLPATRAALMITTGLCAYAAGAAARSWSAYGAAMGVVALFWPQSVVSASFVLSFSCVGAILLLADHIQARLHSLAAPATVKEALALTIATQIGTWPLTLSIFLIVAPYAMLANFLIVPIVGVTMMLTGATLLFSAAPPLAQLFANADSWLLAWIVAVVHTIASLPHAALHPAPPPDWAIILYDCALLASVWSLRRGLRAAALVTALIGIFAVIAPPRAGDTRLRITVLDVGQADGIVIQTPRGHTLLVDAGGRLERAATAGSSAELAGERIVVPFLRRAGVHTIDALILSHPHGDHVGGAAPILRDGFRVGELADSGQRYGGYAYNDALQTAKADRVPVVYPRAGAVWRTDDGVTLTFIGPSLPFIESNNTINDNSIAFILQYKQFRMLFTGDAGVTAERRYLQEGIDLHADVLKVGHHGSAYSSSTSFIAAVHPKYAIISVGRHNMFGHPAPSTIQTLQRFDVKLYRTDSNGATTVRTDGFHTSVSSMLFR